MVCLRDSSPFRRLLIQFADNRDYTSIKTFISEQTRDVMDAAQDKFFVFIENLKYIDKTRNR